MRILLLFVILFTSLSAFAQDAVVPSSPAQIKLSYSPIVKQVAPAVVNIYTKRVIQQRVHPFMNDPFFAPFFGRQSGGVTRERIQNALGSGVIVDPKGIVVTNSHVVNQADEIVIGLTDGRELNAKLILSDPHTDLAVLRISEDLQKDLPFAPLRPSESLEVGDLVIAIGNPFGVGQTVTSGIVSALARSAVNINDYNFFIQTDAAINPGNSGGPLVSMDGGVIGINTAIYSRSGGSLGIGFAIPSEMVNTVLAAAKSGQNGDTGIIRPWLGASFQVITSDLAESLNLNNPSGALITQLHSASPLLASGLGIGDVITSVNGKDIHDPAELRFRIATVPIGEKADLGVLREGSPDIISITAIAPPENPPRNTKTLKGNHPFNGMEISQINPAVSFELGLTEENGVVVANTSQERGLFQMLTAGDIILEVNNQKIKTVDDLETILQASKPQGTSWHIIFNRRGQVRQFVIR